MNIEVQKNSNSVFSLFVTLDHVCLPFSRVPQLGEVIEDTEMLFILYSAECRLSIKD